MKRAAEMWIIALGVKASAFTIKQRNWIPMTLRKSPHHRGRSDRRSRLDRRWIKSPYPGEERRSGTDRRSKIELPGLNPNLPVAEDAAPYKMKGLERLLVSNTIQLEAVTRLLLQKDILDENELLEMMKTVQAEYQTNLAPED
jgi:hypothetical protein